ncbi:MAG TPA: hypothetical protein VJZ27_13900 [Aggregatilineales bacterium]|nr:hypothetical protein [Aggregatilineales bacterium]
MQSIDRSGDIPSIWDTIYQVLILGIIIIVPLVVLFLMFATNLYVNLGGALGVNIERDPNLIIYDAVCQERGNLQELNLVFFSRDSAPFNLKYDGVESLRIVVDANINTLHVNIRESDSCPSIITLEDKSRGRVTSQTVEVIGQ